METTFFLGGGGGQQSGGEEALALPAMLNSQTCARAISW